MLPLFNTRRQFVKNTGALSLCLVTLPSLLFEKKSAGDANKKIVCIGAHPDDPESGCGGTLAKLRNAGHDVTIIYLTTGEAGIPGKSHDYILRWINLCNKFQSVEIRVIRGKEI